MRPEDRDAASIWDALEAAKRIVVYLSAMTFDQYLTSDITRAAVERELTVVAEALNRLSDATVKAHPGISVGKIIGLRNRIIHEYEGIDHQRIFTIAKDRVPELIVQLAEALPPIPPDPEPES